MQSVPVNINAMNSASKQIFPFLMLPAEIRIEIYSFLLLVPQVIDLDPTNYRILVPRLLIFLTSRQVHAEAYPIFYGENTFRLFPLHTRFYYTNRPLLARLPPHYLTAVKTVELRLGMSCNIPLRTWAVTPNLRLCEARNVRVLKIFVENEPIHLPYQSGVHPYTIMTGRLVNSIISHLAGLEEVIFDGFRQREKPSPLITRLLDEVAAAGKKITWGLLRGWKEGNGHVHIDKMTTYHDRDWTMVDLYGDESLDRLLGLLVMT